MNNPALIGKRFRTLIQDCEEDEDYGEVTHPIGSTFVVLDRDMHIEPDLPVKDPRTGVETVFTNEQMYMVSWEQAVCVATGEECKPREGDASLGMWTIWGEPEILIQAEEVAP